MSLSFLRYIPLPAHASQGGFDHAAIYRAASRLYVAHTSNDAVDVVDLRSDRFLWTIPGLAGVAGVLVSEEQSLLFTSNRAEDTVSIFKAENQAELARVSVGMRPNGLAFDPSRGLLLVANVGRPELRGSSTLSLVDVEVRAVTATVILPGRPRWAVYDKVTAAFYVNIADPSVIVAIEAKNPSRIHTTIEIPAKGPHGLDIDSHNRRLFCACDDGKLVAVRLDSSKGPVVADLSGAPDVVFFNSALSHVYVAIGDPGTIDVFDAKQMRRVETVSTELGAHTIAFDDRSSRVFAFLPGTHRVAVYQESTQPSRLRSRQL